MLTDSGGYQIFSLEPKVDDDGATFRSHLRRQHATTSRRRARWRSRSSSAQRHPDGARRVPAAAVAAPTVIRAAVDRTALWAGRARWPTRPPGPTARPRPSSASSRAASTSPCAPRAPSAPSSSTSTATASAACRWGSRSTRCSPRWPPPRRSCRSTSPATSWASATRSASSRPSPSGVDMFDCVLPTRLARHGTILTADGPAQPAQRQRIAPTPGPLDPDCGCPVCARWSRAYLRHLLMVDEPTVRPARSPSTTCTGCCAWWSRPGRPSWPAPTTPSGAAVVDVWGAPST